MQVRGNCAITWYFAPCEIIRVDELNRTELVHNGETVDLAGPFPRLRAGDTIGLLIPSGTLEVTVDEVTGDEQGRLVTNGSFHWDGQYAGLVNGLSGLAIWVIEVPDDAEVVTSAWDVPVPWAVYLAARDAVSEAEWELQFWLGPRDRQVALRYQIAKRMPLPPADDCPEEIDLDLEQGEAV